MAKFPGVKVDLGGREFTVPALRFVSVKQFTKDGTFALIDTMKVDGLNEQNIDAAVRVIRAAMALNYPELTEADVLELVDLRTLPELLGAVTGQSRLEATDPKA
jgi:hypothetical protein